MNGGDATANDRPLVFVTVGTDVHRFDRLMDWIERWAAGPGAHVECVVQHGSSRAPAGVQALQMLPLDDVLALMRRAAVVVAQGGPGSILDSRSCGRIPLVVPRRHAFAEVVDDHQLAFTQRLHADGHIVRVDTEPELASALATALADPDRLRIAEPDPEAVPPAVHRFGDAVEAAVRRRAASGARRRFF